MIAVIDYGMGNLGSVEKAIRRLGAKVKVTDRSSDLKKADKNSPLYDAVNGMKKK